VGVTPAFPGCSTSAFQIGANGGVLPLTVAAPPSKRLAELPEVAIGEVSVMALSQMANPEKQHLAKPRSRSIV